MAGTEMAGTERVNVANVCFADNFFIKQTFWSECFSFFGTLLYNKYTSIVYLIFELLALYCTLIYNNYRNFQTISRNFFRIFFHVLNPAAYTKVQLIYGVVRVLA